MGRDYEYIREIDSISISIHAPRVGRDFMLIAPRAKRFLFQSTRPVWGATIIYMKYGNLTVISIHAPRVGRDSAIRAERKKDYISIHAPRVGRDPI